MKTTHTKNLIAAALAAALAFTAVIARAADPLPSWNDTAPKKVIVAFVERVTKEGSPDFVPPAERIATFDNDGTLWAEQPMYFQFLFAMDRIKALAPQHPEWKTKEPFKSVLAGDMKGQLASGEHRILEIIARRNPGMSTSHFDQSVRECSKTGLHPTVQPPYNKIV